MRVEVSPRRLDIQPGIPHPVHITINNTSTVIAGYELRILGADPSWVEMDSTRVSLFPDESHTLTVQLNLPTGIAAGTRQLAVQVRELTPPHATTVSELTFDVPAAPAVAVRIDPVSVTGGKRGQFAVLLENTGNTVLRAELEAEDAENHLKFTFDPPDIALAPGEHLVADLKVKGRRPLTGGAQPRLINVFLDELPPDGFFADQEASPPTHDETTTVSTGMFVQKSYLNRGSFGLIGLLAAITVFAAIITIALSKLAGQSAADRDLALQIAAAKNLGDANSGTSAISGTVRLLTSQEGVPGVTVQLYRTSDMASPVATTATGITGKYKFSNLAGGDYKITYRGADFLQLWYPSAAEASDGSTVRLPADFTAGGLDVSVGGVPAVLSGKVNGDDLTGATVYLEKSVDDQGTNASGDSVVVAPPTPGVPPSIDNAAVVKAVPVGADGSFSLSDVPSPSRYLLVLTKPGYANSTQTIDVGAGEDRASIQLTLRKGDGSIEGLVSSARGPLPEVTLTATTGSISAGTVSLTEGPRGGFALTNLPTPATYTVVASLDGFTTQTLSIALTEGQQLTGIQLTLAKASGSVSGAVRVATPGSSGQSAPAGGVAVTVSDGATTITTRTQSSNQGNRPAGFWEVTGLPVPGDYTVTFTGDGLESQTVAVSLDGFGNVTAGAGTLSGSDGLLVQLKQATGIVKGLVTQVGSGRACKGSTGLGEAVVTLHSAAAAYTATTASVPSAVCGRYLIPDVLPGSYTLTVEAGSGTLPASLSVLVTAGGLVTQDVPLSRPASITGRLVKGKAALTPCTWTVFLYKIDDYPTTVAAQAKATLSGGACVFTFPRVDAGGYILAASPTPDSVNAQATKTINVQPSEAKGGADGAALKIKVPV